MVVNSTIQQSMMANDGSVPTVNTNEETLRFELEKRVAYSQLCKFPYCMNLSPTTANFKLEELYSIALILNEKELHASRELIQFW